MICFKDINKKSHVARITSLNCYSCNIVKVKNLIYLIVNFVNLMQSGFIRTVYSVQIYYRTPNIRAFGIISMYLYWYCLD